MNQPQSISQTLADINISNITVPIFQREYSWRQQETNQLFDDLLETADSQRNALLGLLVLIQSTEHGHSRSLQIVDGQQRMTTISLLIAVLRKKLIEKSAGLTTMQNQTLWGLAAKLKDCILRERDGKMYPLLQFQEPLKIHAQLYSGMLLSSADLGNQYESDLTNSQYESLTNELKAEGNVDEAFIRWMTNRDNFNQTKCKAKNVRKNFLVLTERINKCLEEEELDTTEKQFEFLVNLSNILLSRFTVISYETQDEEEAFFLFETLNDRGMAVAASDLIKNFCIQKDTAHIDAIGKIWNDIFKNHLPDNTQPMYFLRTFHNSRKDFTTKNDLFSNFKELIRDSNISSSDWLRTEVLPDARRFRTLSLEWQLLPSSPQLKNIFACLNSTNSKQWQTVALSVLRLLEDKRFIPQIRRQTEALLYEILLSAIILELKNKRGSILEKKLPAIAMDVHDLLAHSETDIITSALKKITVDFNTYRGIHDLDTSNLIEILIESSFENSTMRPLLTFLRLHDLNEGDYVGITTVEHVFPQNPDSMDDWPEWKLASESDDNILVRSIGNFINITGETNSSINNSSFSKKKEVYSRVNAPDPVGISSEYHWSNLSEWTPDIVKARATLVANRLSDLLNKPLG